MLQIANNATSRSTKLAECEAHTINSRLHLPHSEVKFSFTHFTSSEFHTYSHIVSRGVNTIFHAPFGHVTRFWTEEKRFMFHNALSYILARSYVH